MRMRCEVDLAAITTDTATSAPALTKSIKSPRNGTLLKRAARPQLASRSTPKPNTREGRSGSTAALSISIEKMIGIKEGVERSSRATCCETFDGYGHDGSNKQSGRREEGCSRRPDRLRGEQPKATRTSKECGRHHRGTLARPGCQTICVYDVDEKQRRHRHEHKKTQDSEAVNHLCGIPLLVNRVRGVLVDVDMFSKESGQRRRCRCGPLLDLTDFHCDSPSGRTMALNSISLAHDGRRRDRVLSLWLRSFLRHAHEARHRQRLQSRSRALIDGRGTSANSVRQSRLHLDCHPVGSLAR